MSVKIHTLKDSTWCNAAGDNVPVKFVPKSAKAKEVYAGKIHKAALLAEEALKSLYSLMDAACIEIKAMVQKEYESENGTSHKPGQGSFTWFSFDRSLKVESEVNDIVKWDETIMTEALALLDKYISGTLGDSHELVKRLVNSAFSNKKGTIDTRKIFQLLQYEKEIKNKHFLKACEIIKSAQSIDRSKLYMRVWEKDEKGEYRNINLNFSSISSPES